MSRVRRFKVVAVGDGATGKTCMLITFAKNEFPEDYIPTVFENYVAEITIENAKYELNLWDTAGQEDYDRLRPLSYPDAHLVFICFSVDNPMSFDNVKEKWAEEVNHFCKTVPKILLGLKIDLRGDTEFIQSLEEQNKKMITSEQGQKLSLEIKANKYIECSAKTRENLQFVFEEAVKICCSTKKKQKGCFLI